METSYLLLRLNDTGVFCDALQINMNLGDANEHFYGKPFVLRFVVIYSSIITRQNIGIITVEYEQFRTANRLD